MGVRMRQGLFLAIGAVLAVVMAVLGVWQMQRSVDSGAAGIRQRAAEPPVPLLEYIRLDGTVADVYGKPVTVSGAYVPGQELLIPGGDGTWRVLAAFQVTDGRVVPIVRGEATGPAGATQPDAVPPAPSGTRTETGLFLPGEGDTDQALPAGSLGSVRMPLLAQKWSQQLTPGFVTLDAAHAAAQGLAPASVTLPQGEKSLMNGSYALQWWLFAAFALGMGIKLAADVGDRERRRLESEAAAAGTVGQEPVPAAGARREDDRA